MIVLTAGRLDADITVGEAVFVGGAAGASSGVGERLDGEGVGADDAGGDECDKGEFHWR